jgi:elongation factor Ts
MSPQYVSRDQISQDVIQKEIEIYKQQAINEGKPEPIAEKIAQGRLEKYFQEVCLLEQSFIKDSGKTIKDLLDEATGKVGEKIAIRRYMRFQLGDDGRT